MQVRFKLDTCGVKLKLAHWNQFTPEEREALVTKPCTSIAESQAYRQFLQNLVVEKTGNPAQEIVVDPDTPCKNVLMIPPNIQEKALEFWVIITIQQWGELTPLQRFALIKLSRPSHENKNFLPALKEFNLKRG